MVDDIELEKYIEQHTQKEPEVLAELSRGTHLKFLRPRMLSGNVQGQFLKMICQMVQARRVLEVGTFTGYAAISMAMGLEKGGIVDTIDINDEIEDFTREYITKSGLGDRIRFHIGEAREVIPQLDEVFDVVFVDADKREYLEYYKLVFDKVRPGGIILADDVLWDGKVLDITSNDAQTKGIIAFNDFVLADERVEKVMLPLRHGLYVIRKKGVGSRE